MNEVPPGSMERFAAAVVHDIRTPLSALSGEVDLARRRERSTHEYRDILSRIGERVSELIDLTENLALLGNPAAAQEKAARVSRLDAALATVAERFGGAIDFTVSPTAAQVTGDETLVTRTLILLLEHAVRHCRNGGRVRLTIGPAGTGDADNGFTVLVIDAPPAGFWPNAWQHLDAAASDSEPNLRLPVRLRTATFLAGACGWPLELAHADGPESVHLRLRHAAAFV